MSRISVTVCLLWLFVGLAISQTQAPTQRIRGDVVALEGTDFQVRTRGGETLFVKLADNYTVTAVVRIAIDAIVPGAYVGTAAMPQPDGTLTALEVLVLPESARGSNEGHYPWDLQPGSMMTNATVADIARVEAARRMRLRYKDGEKVVVVPENVPIVTFEPGDRAMLKPGAHILLTATKGSDGSLAASRVAVGKDGLVPPM